MLDVDVSHSLTSTNVISIGLKFTHNCLYQLWSINDWEWTRSLALQNIDWDAGLAELYAVNTGTYGLEVQYRGCAKVSAFDALAMHQVVCLYSLNSEKRRVPT